VSNMSYCKFENTDRDLDDCADDLERREQAQGPFDAADRDGDTLEPLSDRELRAAASLIGQCVNIVQRVMENRCLESMDEVDDGEIEMYLKSLQSGVELARAERAVIEEGPAQRGDYVPLDGVLRRVIAITIVKDTAGEPLAQYHLDDGRCVGAVDIDSTQVKLESEVGVDRR
jgi:hypothetical protein